MRSKENILLLRENLCRRILLCGVIFLTASFMLLVTIYSQDSVSGGGGGGGTGGSGDKGTLEGNGEGKFDGNVSTGNKQAPNEDGENTNKGKKVEKKVKEEEKPNLLAIPFNISRQTSKDEKNKANSVSASGGTSGTGGGAGTGNMHGDFMGVKAVGNSFVYVVDCSGSMDGTKLTRAKQELKRSINALSGNTERTHTFSQADRRYFYVFFYSDNKIPMPMPDNSSPALLETTTSNINYAFSWIESINTIGGTKPDSSLIAAIELEPSAIYFLTDGDFELPANFLNEHLVGRGIPVHTIAFENNNAEYTLKMISDATLGKYKFLK